jgi:hypothetical protein
MDALSEQCWIAIHHFGSCQRGNGQESTHQAGRRRVVGSSGKTSAVRDIDTSDMSDVGSDEPIDDLVGELSRWLAATRADAAAASRARERWLRQQAEEEATLAGLLLDLAEQGQELVIHTPGERRHRGIVTAVADDFLALHASAGTDVLIRYDGIAVVRPLGQAPVGGDRARALDISFGEAVSALVGDRPRVLIVTRDGQGLSGDLRSAGVDVLTLRLDGEPRATIYVPFASIAELTLSDRG